MNRVLIVLVASFACWQSSLALRTRISQGKNVNIKDVPYQASLLDYSADASSRGNAYCGASILSNQWLVTAAHCLSGYKPTEIKVKTGGSTRDEGQVHEVEETIVHPGFTTNQYTISNDIGLIKLKNQFAPNPYQKPVKLNIPSNTPMPGWTLTISGFGRKDPYTEEKTQHLQAVKLPVVDLNKCKDDYYFDPVNDKMVCAGSPTGASSCKGDSGGPAVANGRLVGIVSSGFLCNTENVPAVFTNVGKYVGWITKHVKNIFG